MANVCYDETKRIIYIHDNIDKDVIYETNKALLQFIKNDDEKENTQRNFERRPIKLYINSNGGFVQDMWSLVDLILISKTPIDTYCTGYAHSCGLSIFLAGRNRYITKHTRMIAHQVSDGKRDTYQDVKEFMKEFEITHNEWKEYLLERCNITEEKINEIIEKKIDYCIRHDELLELGIATGEITEL